MALILPGMSFGISAQFCSRCPGSAFTGVGSLSHRGCVLFLCFTVGNDEYQLAGLFAWYRVLVPSPNEIHIAVLYCGLAVI